MKKWLKLLIMYLKWKSSNIHLGTIIFHSVHSVFLWPCRKDFKLSFTHAWTYKFKLMCVYKIHNSMFTLKVWQFNGLFHSWRMLLGMYRNDRWKSDHEATDNQINLALSFWEIKNELTRNLNFNFIEKHKRHLFFRFRGYKTKFPKRKKKLITNFHILNCHLMSIIFLFLKSYSLDFLPRQFKLIICLSSVYNFKDCLWTNWNKGPNLKLFFHTNNKFNSFKEIR